MAHNRVNVSHMANQLDDHITPCCSAIHNTSKCRTSVMCIVMHTANLWLASERRAWHSVPTVATL